MYSNIVLILIVLLIIIYFIYTWCNTLDSIYIKSNIDNNYYNVINNENRQYAADLLANINIRVEKLLSILKNDNNPIYVKHINNLLSNYSSNYIRENFSTTDITYTINKKEIVICLASRDEDKKIYPLNTLMYVMIHELSHMGCSNIGHGQEFKDFFAFLITKAIDSNLYNYIDYNKNPVEYCGMVIDSSII